MLKANSLLYAVYICLIVSILCGSLLLFANLYNHLNLMYNIREELYIENQSAVNYALGNNLSVDLLPAMSTNGIESELSTKTFGLIKILTVTSFTSKDTVSSTHFVGRYATTQNCLYLSNLGRPLAYSGKVVLKGNLSLPSIFVNEKFIYNIPNVLIKDGQVSLSSELLPAVNPDLKNIFESVPAVRQPLKALEKINDSIYFNSYTNPPLDVQLPGFLLDDIMIKGNFILHSNDSIVVGKKAILEGVILKAPKVTIQDEFNGNIQIFATEGIEIGKDVKLNYPSVVCLYNPTEHKSTLKVKEGTKVIGAIIMYGNPLSKIGENSIVLDQKSLLVGDLYCSGQLFPQGKIYGSVYCNSLFRATETNSADNCLINTEINVLKRPGYFVSIPIFSDKITAHGAFKKVF